MTNLKPMIAVAGCGYWGRNLVRNFAELGYLGAVCDTDEVRLEEMRSKHGVPAIASFEQLLSLDGIRAVAIAAPASQHFHLAKEAMLAGKDVFVEKPLALRVEEGEELVELSR